MKKDEYDLCDINDIRALLEKHGFRFSKALGQNFLIDGSVPRRIAEESLADEDSFVLEIGPGVGCLTRELADRAGRVAAVEIDKRLPEVLAVTLRGRENVEIISGDILKTDIPALVGEKAGNLIPRVCANLPYNVTSPAITALLSPRIFETVTVMIQKEAALRICAAPGTGDYGAFTVFVNWYSEPEMLFDVPNTCFMPRPKVTSTVVRLKKREAPPAKVKDEEFFFKTVKAAFSQRRKTLQNCLVSAFGDRISKNGITKALEKSEIAPGTRGETLGIEEFARLSDNLSDVI